MPQMPSFASMTDLDLDNWRALDHVWTESLWLIDRRDGSGAHSAAYHGNFVPQIPRQFIQRYTRPGEWVLDPFFGSGATAIEAKRLNRHFLGADLNPVAHDLTVKGLEDEYVEGSNSQTVLLDGDSRYLDFASELNSRGAKKAALAVLHPPYHDIIRFTQDPRDLANTPSLDSFLDNFALVLDNSQQALDQGRMIALVIGDKYEGGELIPLGFHVLARALELGLQLKSIIVKDFPPRTSGKRNTTALWRYRALRGGFYIFRHEYILVLRKVR